MCLLLAMDTRRRNYCLWPAACCSAGPSDAQLWVRKRGKQISNTQDRCSNSDLHFYAPSVYISFLPYLPLTILEENQKTRKALTEQRSYKMTGGLVRPCDGMGPEGQGHRDRLLSSASCRRRCGLLLSDGFQHAKCKIRPTPARS